MSIFKDIFEGNCGNHIHPFTGLSAQETEADIHEKVRSLHDAGIRSMVLLWEDPDRKADYAPFNDEAYWTRMEWIVKYCRQYNMTFMIQDAAPFPSGRADGWFDLPEYHHLRKLFLAQRHMDVMGPLPNARFRFDLLTGTKTADGLFQGNGKVPKGGDRLVAALAVKMDNNGCICAPPVDITDCVEEGILFWDVPEGKWRILSVYETHSGGGRVGFMNLLDKESVALQIKAVYEPHYAHLKDEIGKTWVGMFYDEPEVGNMEGFYFTQRLGTPQDLGGKPMDLPWSHEAAQRWAAEQGASWKEMLAYLWYEGAQEEHASVRYRFLELVSRLIRDNYNAQVHAWCQARGLLYIGHVLEDDNSHCRLAVGPVHFFRAEAHQDMGGIDMIGNQMIPGRDYTQAWYGSPEGDGEFFHYGLAKLASSAGHICPDKKGRSVCEIFAVYGALAGTRMRKSVLDHLFVNGITELIPIDPVFPHLDVEYSQKKNEYANRMCHLLTHTKATIKTAVLYHAENEWYAGECMKFQVPAAELAKNQISYDVIPADVFSQREHYGTNCEDGLCINGNRYDALIIPESAALPACVADFLTQEVAERFPVFYVDRYPEAVAETSVPLHNLHGVAVPLCQLAQEVKKSIAADILVVEECRDLRYAHYVDETTHIYMLYNQGNAQTVQFTVPCAGDGLIADLMDLKTFHLPRNSDGTFTLHLQAQESALLCFGELQGLPEAEPYLPATRTRTLSGPWHVRLEDTAQEFELDELKDLGLKGMYPRYVGKVIYEKTVDLTQLPAKLDLGDVRETAKVYINGKYAGLRIAPDYAFDVADLFEIGQNTIRVEVTTNQGARQMPKEPLYQVLEAVSAAGYCPLEPIGMLGPVRLICTP